jgi:ATP-dependent RNA helicase DeaD
MIVEDQINKLESFKKLGIADVLLRALADEKFENPTEIQEKSIPLIVQGKDVIGGAATGSGKTLAFGSGIVQNCDSRAGIQSLVLVPTRELAEQVAKSLEKFSKYKRLEICAIYGGVSINPQFHELRKADVVVGTPGRVLDHLERGSLDLSGIRVLVLDETDRMLDMGFIEDVEEIIKHCSRNRQTMLFSATLPPKIANLAKRYMNNPIEVNAESQVDPAKLKQVYYDVPDSLKFSLLVHLLKHEHAGLVMVFCNTQRNTDFVVQNLQNQGINARAIHGGLSQDKRNKTMDLFHSKDVAVLVCTDVAARGLDIKGVSHVYNYDVPNELNNYVHRIGRTARAGADGIAITILASRDYDQFGRLLRTMGVKIDKIELPDVNRVNLVLQQKSRGFSRGDSYSHGGRFGSSRGHSSSRGSGGYGMRRGGESSNSRFGGRRSNRRNSKMSMRNSKRMWR